MNTPCQTESLKFRLKSLLESSGFEVSFRTESPQLWQTCFELLEFQRISASNSFIDYSIEYEQGNGRQCDDLSLVLISNQQAVAIWPLSINSLVDSKYLARPGGSVSVPHCLSSTSTKLNSKISKICYKICIHLAQNLGQKELSSSCFEPGASALSPWQIYAMQLGASCSIKHEALVDLSPPIAQ